MAKTFTDINTNFDVLGTITGEATAPKKESPKKPAIKTPGEKKETKKDSSSISIETKEPKTKRATLLLKESTFKKLSSYATKYNLSFNDLINQILEKVEL